VSVFGVACKPVVISEMDHLSLSGVNDEEISASANLFAIRFLSHKRQNTGRESNLLGETARANPALDLHFLFESCRGLASTGQLDRIGEL
jgi:hypothetical protein